MAAITASGSIVNNNSFRDIIMSPKGAEGVSELIRDGINADSPATKKGQSVAQGCRAELLGNVLGQ